MSRLPFTLEQLRTFVAVGRFESMSRAAESLFLTQGAVSQQVMKLEAALGLRLLERSSRRVWLTEAGRSIAVACEAATRAVDSVAETAHLLTTLEIGLLQIGASPTSAGHYLPAMLTAFSALHPTVRVRVATENSPTVAAKVVAGILDCAMIEGGAEGLGLVDHRIAEDEAVVVVGRDHPLAGRPDFAPADLELHRYLAREPGAALDAIAIAMIGEHLRPLQRMEFGHLDAVRSAAVAGLGFAVLPRVAVMDRLRDGSLVLLPIPPRRRWISMIRRPSRGGAALEEFWRVVLAATEDRRPPARRLPRAG